MTRMCERTTPVVAWENQNVKQPHDFELAITLPIFMYDNLVCQQNNQLGGPHVLQKDSC